MDSKRCMYCQKFSPADAETCNRCGHLFSATTRRMRSSESQADSTGSYPSRSSRPSIPPASPHRAGHHPGLHPEDQPYQSSMMEALRLPKKQQDHEKRPQASSPRLTSPLQYRASLSLDNTSALPEESNGIRLSPTPAAPLPSYLMLPTTPPAVRVPPQSIQKSSTYYPPDSAPTTHGHAGSDSIATANGRLQGLLPLPLQDPQLTRKPRRRHTMPIAFIIGCLVLLLISSTLAYLFINKKPELPAPALTSTPGQLHVHDTFMLKGSSFGARDLLSFTRDLSIIVLDSNGKPLTAHADDKGTFSVQITVQPDWSVGQHSIHATDEAQNLSISTTITIQQALATGAATTTVKASPSLANLLASPAYIAFKTTAGQNPATQPITLQNGGGQPLDWTVNTGTVDGANWLSMTPTSGHLEPNAQANVHVKISATTLNAGQYQGRLTFSYGTLTQQVGVALTVSTLPLAIIGLQPNLLLFTTTKGTNPRPQTFSITDTGDATLNWSLTEDQNGTKFASVTPTRGSLAPGKSATITVTPTVAQAALGMINATISISDGDRGTTVQSQKITARIVVNPVLTLSTNTITFNNSSSLTITTQSLTITNNGPTSLDWTATPSTLWLSSDPSNGTLAPGESLTIYIFCDSTQLSTGMYPATLVISGSKSGTEVVSQTLNVVLVVGP